MNPVADTDPETLMTSPPTPTATANLDGRLAADCSHGHLEVDVFDLVSATELGVPAPCGLKCAGPFVELRVGPLSLAFRWGLSGHLASAAFWVARTKDMSRGDGDHRLADTLPGEVVACILGGWGVKAELGLAAFAALARAGLVRTDQPPSASVVEEVLRRPLDVPGVGDGVRYRFPSQRGRRVADALRHLAAAGVPPGDAEALRGWLQDVPGVGPKTAAWIVRNRAGVDDVAIVDVHVRRAGIAAGFFDPAWRLPDDYDLFERAFLTVALLGGVSGAMLDACIWQTLHRLGPRRWPALLGDVPG